MPSFDSTISDSQKKGWNYHLVLELLIQSAIKPIDAFVLWETLMPTRIHLSIPSIFQFECNLFADFLAERNCAAQYHRTENTNAPRKTRTRACLPIIRNTNMQNMTIQEMTKPTHSIKRQPKRP